MRVRPPGMKAAALWLSAVVRQPHPLQPSSSSTTCRESLAPSAALQPWASVLGPRHVESGRTQQSTNNYSAERWIWRLAVTLTRAGDFFFLPTLNFL